MTDIGGEWYMEKFYNGLPPLKISKLSKKAQYKEDLLLKKLYEANK